MKPRAIFLDRDGVINAAVVRDGRPYPPRSVEELRVLPGVPEALERLRHAGYRLVVVTNQPDVARRVTSRDSVDAIHAALRRQLPLDEIRACFHDDSDGCSCRKPLPGLLMQEPRHDMAASVLVGDRWRDIEAGRAAGCGATVLVDYEYDERQAVGQDATVQSLAEAAEWVLTRDSARAPQEDM